MRWGALAGLTLLALASGKTGGRPTSKSASASKRFKPSPTSSAKLVQQTAQAAGEGQRCTSAIGQYWDRVWCAGERSIDLYPDYIGSGSPGELLNSTVFRESEKSTQQLAPNGSRNRRCRFVLNKPYAVAMRAAAAQKQGIRTLSDLARHADMRSGYLPGSESGHRLAAFRHHSDQACAKRVGAPACATARSR